MTFTDEELSYLKSQPLARPRFLRVYGTADVVERAGQFGPSVYLRIKPTLSWSWHLDGRAAQDQEFAPNRTVHAG